MAIAHHLGFPRIGLRRELKQAVEQYWKGQIKEDELKNVAQTLRHQNWEKQIAAKHDFLSVGDFSYYDHVLDTSALLGVIPSRFGQSVEEVDLNTYFRMARGQAGEGQATYACEMTKWFDTNYHYLVPEFEVNQEFKISSTKLFDEVKEAKTFGKPIKPILLGPLSYLWLGKAKTSSLDKLALLEKLKPVYIQILSKLSDMGIEWVQIDEPILTLDLPATWQHAFRETYQQLNIPHLKLLLTTYFGGLESNTQLACELPTAGLHIDIVRAPHQLADVLNHLPSGKTLSVGIVDGRNVWRTNLRKALAVLKPLHQKLRERLWVGSACSLLHSPIDLEAETKLDKEFKSWLAFAIQKLDEIAFLAHALKEEEAVVEKKLIENDQAIQSRQASKRIHNEEVKKRCNTITKAMTSRESQYLDRQKKQRSLLNLPLFPTTTIGSFPQTQAIRDLRREFRLGKLEHDFYCEKIREHIAHSIEQQLKLKIDVLVHGEAERNDMVEYFGELLEGFAFTENGWVQSYGSRCVKPPIIYGDVSRSKPMTVSWTTYAQSLTDKPVKGMLTGPITILSWSFVRDDQSRFETAKQIAIALRDEVTDLAKAGIHVIQIDEPAFREGLPLLKKDWDTYLQQAVYCFRLASCCVPDSVQIHTHMCYSEFNDIIKAVAELDADVITIETSRSNMELLQAFEGFNYPNEIGPGVYDIHSPRIPDVNDMIELIQKAAHHIPVQQLWINPDCGLKTRSWDETTAALKNMVSAAEVLREKYSA